MDKTRTLPPLVRGKVTGVLDFFVDKIRLSRNILLLTDNFDLVLQVQWWGEVIPACIRPKALHVEGRANKSSHFIESYYHSAKYEIKTTLDLFKSYLKCCEVVELSVLETFKNYVIGSAFLKDLIKLLNSNNELIQMPLFDYLGEEIGEVIVHVNFLEKPPQENNKKQSEAVQLCNMSVNKKLEKQDYNPSKIKSCFSLGEKTISYDGHSKKSEAELCIESQVPVIRDKFRKNENMDIKSTLSVSQNSTNILSTNNKPICKDHTCFPQVKTLSDSSKVLYYGVNSQVVKKKTDIKNPKTKITSKFNSNTIKCKSKPAETDFNRNCKKFNVNKPEGCKSLVEKSILSKKEEDNDCRPPIEVHKFMKSKPQLHYKPGDVRNVPSEESSHIKVLNYLLGSDMSKDDEETALSDFKKMSPSHNLVDSISELCLFSSNESTKSINKFNVNSSPRKTHLNFDFNNPIERNYYERFFLKSNCAVDFEIAEFLNKPENRFMLNKLKSNEISSHKSESEMSNYKSINEFSFGDKEMKGTESVECLAKNAGTGDRSSCARCKYYRKLNELDTIIESLKHFEEKMVSHEKKLQSSLGKNPGMVPSTDHLLKDTF